MNNELNQPKNNDEWSPFEQRLRDQALCPQLGHLGEIMYECGYAAGVAASRKRTRVVTTRWQVVSLAASALACLSFSSHFFSTEVNRSDQFGKGNSGNAAEQKSTDPEPQIAGNAWVMHLTRDRQPDQRTAGTLRASWTPKDTTITGGLEDELESIPLTTPNPPLRPSDFPLFL